MKKYSMILVILISAMMFSGCTTDMPTQNTQAQTNSVVPQVKISEDQAKDVALTHAKLTGDKVTFSKAKLSNDDGILKYELEFYVQGENKKYEYDIDANTGEVLSQEYKEETSLSSSSASQGVDAAKAKKTALAKVPGSSEKDIVEFKEDFDDGRKVFEGKIVYNKMEYEFEIDAVNGTVTKWESESVYS